MENKAETKKMKKQEFLRNCRIELMYGAPGDYKHRENGERDVTGNLNFNGKREKHVIQ